ncbi:MAG: laccase domain-containing protein [Acidimicrobiales bacterium]
MIRHAPPDWTLSAGGGARAIHVVATERRHGDLDVNVAADLLDTRRRAIVDAPWSWCHQVHGAAVHVVEAPGAVAGLDGDGLCTAVSAAPISVRVADCAPVVLADPAGLVAVLHAGWRGLMAGIIAEGAAAMGRLGATEMVAVLGPCIRPDRYEFGADDLGRIIDRFGPAVAGTTSEGRPALDLPTAVRAALDEHGIDIAAILGGCTAAEDDRRWSHRARGERERQAVVAWIDGVAP